MSFSQKITLENAIFARAGQLCVPVYGKAGQLISSSVDLYLQTLLYVYNAFFYEENWKNFCVHENHLEAFYNFKKITAHTPVLSGKEYKFELIMEGKYA